ncbi:MAG: FAD-dependent oxidoreductase [Acidobacteriota bacterium]|nr:FAD-dependent oxidoreductase [Acidobacteriota bacterium]
MLEERISPQVQDEAVEVVDSIETTCCVVGAGPGGAILALLLARQGIPVILLEAHDDFDRDFRGDTIHPSVLHLMDELGLAERLLQLRHSKLHTATISTPDGPITVADFRRVDKKFPYIMMVPQAHFLEFITNETTQYPSFRLLMGASVQELIEKDGFVRGVRYRADDGWHEVRSALTIGADGRSSRIRKLAGFKPVKTSPPMDILWFRMPRKPEDPEGVLGYLGRGHGLVLFDRLKEWQTGFIIIKGSYSQIRAAGLEALRKEIAALLTAFPDRIEHLQDWKQVSVLSVESSRVRTWYKPGLLLIGDAAHVMSPVGGVGINYAIQDAVVAANVLTAPLRAGRVTTGALAEVQKQREFPTSVIQWIQAQGQKRVITAALRSNQPLRVPWFVRLLLRAPFIGDLPARVLAHGIKTVHISHP